MVVRKISPSKELEALRKQEEVLKNELKYLKQKLVLDTSQQIQFELEQKIERNIQRNKELSKLIKEVKNALTQNGNQIEKTNVNNSHNKVVADGIGKLIKKEKRKELLTFKSIRYSQGINNEKKALELELKDELKNLQNNIQILKQTYYSNFDKYLEYRLEGEVLELKTKLEELKVTLQASQEKNKVKVDLLRKEIEFMKSKLRTQKIVSLIDTHKIQCYTKIISSTSHLKLQHGIHTALPNPIRKARKSISTQANGNPNLFTDNLQLKLEKVFIDLMGVEQV